MALLAFVKSTSASQTSHLLIQARLGRKEFTPGALCTDIAPANENFWKKTLGADTKVLLGLFHLMQRILDTLDHRCQLYWECLVMLQNCVCKCYDEDLENLLVALKGGLFCKDGKKLSDTDIKKLRHSKKWKQRHSGYSRKHIHRPETIIQELTEWVEFWNAKSDNDGKPAFTKKTEVTVENQKKKVKCASDPPNVEMYRCIPAKKSPKHNLKKCISLRPEPALERDHGKMAHYGNTKTKAARADSLTLGGVADDDVKKRWKLHRD